MPMIVIILLLLLGQTTGCVVAVQAPEPRAAAVRFVLRAPAASTVAVSGDFNRWAPDRDLLRGPDQDGVWSVTLLLDSGTYTYLFVVNGREWVRDPAAPATDDGMGGSNSLVIVP